MVGWLVVVLVGWTAEMKVGKKVERLGDLMVGKRVVWLAERMVASLDEKMVG